MQTTMTTITSQTREEKRQHEWSRANRSRIRTDGTKMARLKGRGHGVTRLTRLGASWQLCSMEDCFIAFMEQTGRG